MNQRHRDPHNIIQVLRGQHDDCPSLGFTYTSSSLLFLQILYYEKNLTKHSKIRRTMSGRGFVCLCYVPSIPPAQALLNKSVCSSSYIRLWVACVALCLAKWHTRVRLLRLCWALVKWWEYCSELVLTSVIRSSIMWQNFTDVSKKPTLSVFRVTTNQQEESGKHISCAHTTTSYRRTVFRNLFLLAAHHEVSMTQHGTPKC
jgi:hypothetical protein